jgi:hypothetical protein
MENGGWKMENGKWFFLGALHRILSFPDNLNP